MEEFRRPLHYSLDLEGDHLLGALAEEVVRMDLVGAVILRTAEEEVQEVEGEDSMTGDLVEAFRQGNGGGAKHHRIEI